MQIIEDVRTTEMIFPELVLTIGSFDGIHLGHRRILERLIQDARPGGTAALMTMRPHPREFFSPENPPNILTSDAQKERLLEEGGLDVMFVLPFTAAVCGLDRRDFIAEIIAGRCRAKKVIVGHDFTFGKDAAGNYEYLQSVGPEFGFDVHMVPPLYHRGERISSTLIREAILQGALSKAKDLLGRDYSILGNVVPGRGHGRNLGFPTANIKPLHNAVPAQGVYAVRVYLRGNTYAGAVNIGIAPTLRNEDLTIEAHILDFEGQILGEEIEIAFLERLRSERKFPCIEALTDQIRKDVDHVRTVCDP